MRSGEISKLNLAAVKELVDFVHRIDLNDFPAGCENPYEKTTFINLRKFCEEIENPQHSYAFGFAVLDYIFEKKLDIEDLNPADFADFNYFIDDPLYQKIVAFYRGRDVFTKKGEKNLKAELKIIFEENENAQKELLRNIYEKRNAGLQSRILKLENELENSQLPQKGKTGKQNAIQNLNDQIIKINDDALTAGLKRRNIPEIKKAVDDFWRD